MTNLELHNKLLEVAKEIEKQKAEHADIASILTIIEHPIEAGLVEEPARHPTPLLYRKSGSSAS